MCQWAHIHTLTYTHYCILYSYYKLEGILSQEMGGATASQGVGPQRIPGRHSQGSANWAIPRDNFTLSLFTCLSAQQKQTPCHSIFPLNFSAWLCLLLEVNTNKNDAEDQPSGQDPASAHVRDILVQDYLATCSFTDKHQEQPF